MERCLCYAWRGELMALSFACANRGLVVCIDATTGSVGIFPKSVAGKCPKKFYKDRICLKFQLMVRLGKVRLV